MKMNLRVPKYCIGAQCNKEKNCPLGERELKIDVAKRVLDMVGCDDTDIDDTVAQYEDELDKEIAECAAATKLGVKMRRTARKREESLLEWRRHHPHDAPRHTVADIWQEFDNAHKNGMVK